jgi:hypothetical protein
MKHPILLRWCGLCMGFLALVACGPTPTTVVVRETNVIIQTVEVTALPTINQVTKVVEVEKVVTATSTATPTPTATLRPPPTPTSSLTPSPTLPPTRTPRPSSTPPPTETPIPSFTFSTDFESLDNLGNYWLDRGGRYSIVPDPTGTGRGTVLKCEAAPDLAYLHDYGDVSRMVVRSCPDQYWPAQRGPHKVGVDVLVKDNFSPQISSTPDGPYLSVLSDFYDSEGYGKVWGVAATADLYLRGSVYYLKLGNVKNGQARPSPAAPPFTFDKWHRVDIVVTKERRVILYQDGQIVATGELADSADLATAGGHAGLYGIAPVSSNKAPFESGTLYNDNWSVVVWPR